jgi:hypothetical protein
MEVFEDKGHRGDSASQPPLRLCSTAGCDHPARGGGDLASAGLCNCCRRRNLEHQLSEARTEASLLSGQIARLPGNCLYEVQPEYERIST